MYVINTVTLSPIYIRLNGHFLGCNSISYFEITNFTSFLK